MLSRLSLAHPRESAEVSSNMQSAVLGILDSVLGSLSDASARRRLQPGSIQLVSIAIAESSVAILRNLFNAANAAPGSGAASRALQAHSSASNDVLSKLLVIHARVVADALPNEAAVALTAGLAWGHGQAPQPVCPPPPPPSPCRGKCCSVRPHPARH